MDPGLVVDGAAASSRRPAGTSASALFLDRDGVLNERAFPFVPSPRRFRWRPGVLDALATAKRAGWKLVVVTDQWPVGSGVLPRAAHEAIQRRLVDEAAAAGGAFDRVVACEHAWGVRCDERKPSPKALLDAARDLGIDLATSWMVGDQLKDVLAGRGAGCRTALVNAAARPQAGRARRLADLVAASLPDVVDRVVARRLVPTVAVPVDGEERARVLPRRRE